MFCRTNNIMRDILHIQYECEEYFVKLTVFNGIFLTFSLNVINIMQNIVSPTKHCYGSE